MKKICLDKEFPSKGRNEILQTQYSDIIGLIEIICSSKEFKIQFQKQSYYNDYNSNQFEIAIKECDCYDGDGFIYVITIFI